MSPTPVIPPLSEDYSDIIVRRSSDSSFFHSVFPPSGTQNLPDSFTYADFSRQADMQAQTTSIQSTSADAQAQTADERYEQIVNNQYTILYAPLSEHLATVEEIGYSAVPKLFTEINVVSLEAAGILPVRIRSGLELSGAGVLIGFLDSGIDYTHPAFRNPDGTTRILRLWDQADTRGAPPEGIAYGTEFTQNDINRALFYALPDSSLTDTLSESSAPIPDRDLRGHGTAVAGIACGSPDAGEGFTGVAPESAIAFVRPKSAKQYLREYFRIPEGAAAYQENDLMLGVRYLLDCSRNLSMPLVICMSLGSSQGGHTGDTPLEKVLDAALYAGSGSQFPGSSLYMSNPLRFSDESVSANSNSLLPGDSLSTGSVCAVTGTGNEAGLGHHFYGQLRHPADTVDAELLIEQETEGFFIEFWANAPDLFRVGLTSPLGETISPITPDQGFSREFSFLLERSRISLSWSAGEPPEGSQVILLRFADPTPGIWRIRVEGMSTSTGQFHLWLPISGLVSPGIRFLAANEDTTLVIPACASRPLAVGVWNAYSNSLYPHSGRGYTRNGLIRPDFVSPGVRVTCPAAQGGYSSVTGSCAASALTAGAAALLLDDGLRQTPPRLFSSEELKELFLRGIRQDAGLTYPNPSWGYGILNLFDAWTNDRQAF